MTSRKKLAALLVAGMALGAAAPAMAASKPLLVFVPNGPSDFWEAAVAGMKKAQAELPGFKLELEYPQQATVAAQQQLMEDLVTAGAKGIMVSAVDPKTSTTGLNKIASETTLFTTDSDAPQTNRVVYIGSSNIDAGLQAAEIAKKRIEGFKQGLAGTKITLVDVRGDDLDQTRAKENVSDVLVADPSVTCLVGFYSYNTPQIYAALKEAGELGKITVVGFDGLPATLGGVKEGTIAATVVQQPFLWAYQGMKLLAAYVNGDKSGIPKSGLIIVPTKIVTQQTVDAYVAEQQAMAGK
jgi:ribose transport system substrate-binding protein